MSSRKPEGTPPLREEESTSLLDVEERFLRDVLHRGPARPGSNIG